jgi:hypothetical protein
MTMFTIRAGRVGATVLCAWLAVAGVRAGGQEYPTFGSPVQLVQAMIAKETESASKHERYSYMSNERSDRTGGHMWTEKVVETGEGRVRFLEAEDGTPLSAERVGAERARLADIAAHPDAFTSAQAAQQSDELKARQMLDELPKAFVLENVKLEGGTWRVDFRPNPGFSPSGMQARVLDAMTGWLAIDAKDLRLVHIEGHLPGDVSIGFGILATIKAGSHFMSDRAYIDGHWRTVHVVTDIRGKAILFKSVSKNSDIGRSDFHYLQGDITLADAVTMAEDRQDVGSRK